MKKTPTNFERMLQLADEVFASRTDPDQLDVNEKVLAHLREIHPATVSSHEEEGGPVAWLLVIPSTLELMQKFLDAEISERQLYDQTPLHATYEALYLCSAMVLEEYRRKGFTKKMSLEAIDMIRKDHPIQALFVWTFSKEGLLSAEALAKAVKLPLYHRTR